VGSRRKSRERALQILFQLDFRDDDIETIRRDFWSRSEAGPKVREFADTLVTGVCANRETIDRLIESTLEHWSMERLASVDRAILRCAIFELLYMPDIPPKVTINEAVEIAKAFGTEESGRFVNGVLDKIKNETRAPSAESGVPKIGDSEE
jgi:N utilization substance protein B